MRRFSQKYFVITVVISLCILFSFQAFNLWAASLSEVERDNIMKAVSPMDKEPDVISLQKGESVVIKNSKEINLNGNWQVTDKGVEGDLIKPGAKWNNAIDIKVPSSIHTALYEAGVVANPMYVRNDAEAKSLSEKTWFYKKTFTYDGSGKNVWLCFDGVADRCTVYLNGKRIGTHQGMFGGPYFDITDNIKDGENTLVVVLKPALHYSQSAVIICNYAWHYADIPPIGIWNDVYIKDVTDVAIDSPFITTVSHETGTLDLSVDLKAMASNTKISGTLNGTIRPYNFNGDAYSFSYEVNADSEGDTNVRLRFDLPEFKLWWPNGSGEQNLYTLEVSFTNKNGATCYTKDTFGVRTLEMTSGNRNELSSMYNRTVVINGKPIFMKGAGWCTIDATMNFERKDYDRILSRAYDQGVNFLRAWGGGLPETDEFYDLCNEYGICVYQEWPCCWDSQITQPWNVLSETIILNTKRIRNNPSLIVYGGGNEGNAAPNDTAINNMGKLTYQYDGTRDFWRQDGGYGGAGMTHDHIWWGGQSAEHYASVYANSITGNLHEYGLGAMMNIESIAKYATKDEMAQWPIDPAGTIAYHTATFNGMKGWNPSPHGYDIDTHMWYANHFIKVDSLESLVTGSQIAQTMAKYFAVQNSRINYPDISTVCYYKLNDNYPGASWAVVDWYGSPKMAYYFIQDAFEPLMATGKFDRYNTFDKPTTDLDLPIYILDDNDELKNSDWKVTVKAYDDMLKLVKEQSWEGNGSTGYSKHIGNFYLDENQTDSAPLYIVIDLEKNGEHAARSYAFMNAEKEQGSLFYVPTAKLEYSVSGNTYTITNKSDVPAVGVKFICPSVSDTFRPSDNYFWLEPGETKTITVNSTKGVEGFTAFNMADIDDTQAPGVPTKVKAESKTFDSITLTWSAAKDNNRILQYEIYVNGEYYDYVGGTFDKAIITGLNELSYYELKIVAVDGNMNRSEDSQVVICQTIADNNAPIARRMKFIDVNNVEIIFSRPVNATSASNVEYYIMNNGAIVTSARLLDDGVTVALTIEGIDESKLTEYTLTVMGVQDTTITGNYATRNKFKFGLDVIGHWTFDDGDSIIDSSHNHEADGKKNDSEIVDGKFGKGLLISSNGETLLTNTTSFMLDESTISFWMKADNDLAGFNVLLAKGDKISGHFEIYANDGILRIYGPEIGDVGFNVNLNKYKGQWTHLAFTCENNRMTLYINGEKNGTIRFTGKLLEITTKLCIGSLPAGAFKTVATFDDVYLFDTVLSDADVAKLYTNDIATDVSMESSHYQIKVGTSKTVKIKYTGSASEENIKLIWISSDETIATVNQQGVVTTYDEYGLVVITAYTEDGKYIEKCIIETGDFPEEEEKKNPINPIIILAICCGALVIGVLAFVTVYILRISKKNDNRNMQ